MEHISMCLYLYVIYKNTQSHALDCGKKENMCTLKTLCVCSAKNKRVYNSTH